MDLLDLSAIRVMRDDELTSKVEQTIRHGFTPLMAARLVGIHDKGYQLICQLITIRDNHKSPDVRVEAKSWLQLIDEKNEIGSSLKAITNFIQSIKSHKVRREVKLPEVKKPRVKLSTWRKLTSQGHTHMGEALNRLRARGDMEEGDKQKIDELLASIVGEKMPGRLYAEAKALLANHKITKQQLARKINSTGAYVHAIELACQMCDNLSDLPHAKVFDDKAELIARLSSAALTLLKIQRELIEGGPDDHQERRKEDRDPNHIHRD
jgi:hypothetical protein